MSEVMMSPNMSNEEVIEILKGMTFCCNFYRIRPKEREALDLAIKSLEERPQGEWIRIDDEKVKCPICEVIHLMYSYPGTTANFCPSCGADMRGKEE